MSRHEPPRSASRRRAAPGESRGSAQLCPLLGVPMPIKDLTQIAGAPFEAGSAAMAGNIATVTDGVAQKILDAGTLTVGKTTAPEFGLPGYTSPPPVPRPAPRGTCAAPPAVPAAVRPVAVAAGIAPPRPRLQRRRLGADPSGLLRHRGHRGPPAAWSRPGRTAPRGWGW